ncbi:uncharacterized protein LOC125505803 [Dendroctonus ponderosae]|uniref:uncharacterized protein LOC125505803 n=1 Tax=Dendroctonus ponderosae TaxID=77166 RepID=UPI002034D34D|nr:uncharacterized protein LOC125505803 [Dendroctonus ponderosae]KAH1028243.1 hypothetical protein HUJ05_001618 [Dendroctonus ponderosae]
MVSERTLHVFSVIYVVLVFSQFSYSAAVELSNSATSGLVAKHAETLQASMRKSTEKNSMMSRILPMLIVPFLISSAIIPIMLAAIKVLLVKGFITGTIAVVLMLLNFIRRRAEGGGVFDHYAPNVAEEHYGYQGVDEPGVYVHRRRKRRFANIFAISS